MYRRLCGRVWQPSDPQRDLVTMGVVRDFEREAEIGARPGRFPRVHGFVVTVDSGTVIL
jgi:hypothetical protein